jgi:hypothetical protein
VITHAQKKLEDKGHKEWNLVKNAVKAEGKFHHRHKHKIIGGTALTIVAVVVVVVVITLAVVAAVVVNRNKSAAQKARDAATSSAAVKIGKISVVPPKEETGRRRRRVLGVTSYFQALSDVLSSTSAKKSFRGLADASSIDISEFAIDTDYKTTPKSEYVEDGLAEQLSIPNMILCMLEQTNADAFMVLEGESVEPYVANVDENKCQGGGGGNSKPRMTPWTVIATMPSKEVCDTNDQGEKVNCANVAADDGLIQVSAWLLINGGQTELEFKLEVEKSTVVIHDDSTVEINDLRIQFREVEEDSDDSGGQSNGQPSIEGVIAFNRVGGKSRFQFYISMGVSVVSEATKDAGWAKVSSEGQGGAQSVEVSW